ncbi:hypothetical protein SERLA73DRAFT_78188 [Serpula lacrymans var. lacrymans S7.3]|uniref:Uncharacterized protein n=2 Tax=Serpula lacrymans var. lacrymans TaxID=341189 RepID=F8QCE7_SERL3|nr:uncharacterized protein SERLADRAFT_443224 [Serpula lacrymans var. lacrymans S7.9]EGN93812.1 hypothetical protein SERLA73DRAFT_78188 [Serpula lacrymans var. lacrymans S7.3]EGO19179.1 hypothetical protein SERLADRAFT_443224 [Serpula lacrymans var. lacrymans S7.9]
MGQQFRIEYWSDFVHGTLTERIPRTTLEEELQECRERSGQSLPTVRGPDTTTTGHPFPGRHHPHSPPQPQPASCPSSPDLILPAPAPPSPAHSSTTDSIISVANVVEELQDILIPMQPAMPLPQLP